MNLILDLIVIGIVILTIRYAKKQGFVKIITMCVGLVLALILGVSMSTPLADYTYNEYLEPRIINAAGDMIIDGSKDTLNNVWNSLPKWITKNSEKLGFSEEEVDEILMDNYGNDARETFADISRKLIRPGVINFLEAFFIILIVAALWALVGVASDMLNALFKAKKLEAVNSSLAAILGFIGGVVIIIVFTNLVESLLYIFPDGLWFLNQESISHSVLFKFFMNIV